LDNLKIPLILIVDDTEANRALLHDFILMQGFNSCFAENGEIALKVMRERDIDVVLLDIMMPVMDGHEVLIEMKQDKVLRDLPVIMITADDNINSIVHCLERGADDYLTKPFNSILLKARINGCLEKKRARDLQIELYDKIAENYDALQEAEEARDNLVHMVVHDLNNPLSVIRGMSEMILDLSHSDDIDKDVLKDFAVTIENSVEETFSLTRGMLDVSRLESGEMPVTLSEVNLVPVLTEICAKYDYQIEQSGGKILLNDIPEKLSVQADSELISRVIQNLLSNAIKHTRTDSDIELSFVSDDEWATIEVADNGKGIPQDYLTKIFDKYFRVRNREIAGKYSVGLGLAFCKIAVEAQQGQIWAESEEGRGASFFIKLRKLAS